MTETPPDPAPVEEPKLKGKPNPDKRPYDEPH